MKMNSLPVEMTVKWSVRFAWLEGYFFSIWLWIVLCEWIRNDCCSCFEYASSARRGVTDSRNEVENWRCKTNFNDFSVATAKGWTTENNCRWHGRIGRNNKIVATNSGRQTIVRFSSIYANGTKKCVVFLCKPLALNCFGYFYTGPLTVWSL